LGHLRIRSKLKGWFKRNIHKIEANCKIIKYKGGQYYLLLSVTKEKDSKPIPFDTVSLDAGVRKFQTYYSPIGIAGTIGDGFVKTYLEPIAHRIDHLDSVAAHATRCKTRLHIRKRQTLLRNKIKNMVNDLHWKTVNFLCNNFKTIITTHFEVKNMVNGQFRNIGNKTVRNMLGLSHYAFKQKLLDRAKRKGNHVMIIDESYTSKTCGKCGELKDVDKIYECDKCGLVIDRDMNGARNILLRLLS